MTVRNLASLLNPSSVALFGASATPGSLGYVVAKNLIDGGFRGQINFVNPKYTDILGHICLPDAASLDKAPELAVFATPAPTIPPILTDLAARGTKAAVIISSGFGGAGGAQLKRDLLNATKPSLMRVLGPNGLGLIVPQLGLNASFAHIMPLAGSIALLAQSGAILTSVIDWAAARQIGFSHLVSMGEMTDVDFGDMLDYLAGDTNVSAIMIYAEAVTNARKFVSAARRAARMKPVVIIKAGRHQATAKAVASHTGALAGSDAVYDAVFRRIGILRVADLNELFEAVETLAMATQPNGKRLAILTNGGGIGILAADALVSQGGEIAVLQPQTIANLDSVLPDTWSHANPVDIIGDAPAERYRAALLPLLEDPDADAILVLNCPTAVTPSIDAARAVVAAVAGTKKCILTSWIGELTSREPRELFATNRIPSYETPEQATRAFMNMVRYRHNRALLAETPPSLPADFLPDTASARVSIEAALNDGRDFLTAPESMAVLQAYQIPTVTDLVVRSPAEAREAAAKIGGRVALKLLSPDLTHKSDIGGVVLDLQRPKDVESAAEEMHKRISLLRPDARLEGFTVSPMIDRGDAYELIIGAAEDPLFGPVLMFGHGGIAVEVVADRSFALPPLNLKLAHELISGTRIYDMLRGFRNQPAVAMDEVALTLVKISQLIVDVAEIVELDINPLLASTRGVIALDARIRVKRTMAPAAARLAIRPYPRELEEAISLGNGTKYFLRPIRPEDEPALVSAFQLLSPKAVEFRFFRALSTLPHELAAQLTQIDYDREMAFVVTDPHPAPNAQIYGVVRMVMDPDRLAAEFAIIVRDDVTGQGLGTLLMQKLLAYGQAVGLTKIAADILAANRVMLAICGKLGFLERPDPNAPSVIHVEKLLTGL